VLGPLAAFQSWCGSSIDFRASPAAIIVSLVCPLPNLALQMAFKNPMQRLEPAMPRGCWHFNIAELACLLVFHWRAGKPVLVSVSLVPALFGDRAGPVRLTIGSSAARGRLRLPRWCFSSFRCLGTRRAAERAAADLICSRLGSRDSFFAIGVTSLSGQVTEERRKLSARTRAADRCLVLSPHPRNSICPLDGLAAALAQLGTPSLFEFDSSFWISR